MPLSISIFLLSFVLKQDLSRSEDHWIRLTGRPSKPWETPRCHYCNHYSCFHCYHFRWVQGILTHNLMIVEQRFDPLKYLPNARYFFWFSSELSIAPWERIIFPLMCWLCRGFIRLTQISYQCWRIISYQIYSELSIVYEIHKIVNIFQRAKT